MIYRTRDPDEALAFVDQLRALGYEATEVRSGRGGIIARNCFRVSFRRGWNIVCYYEPTTRRPIPKADPVSRKGSNQHRHPFKGRACPCGTVARCRGLCWRCYARWQYWREREAA